MDIDIVNKMAHLARLTVSEVQAEKYAQDLSEILKMIDEMSAVDTQDVAPMAHPIFASQRLREDDVTEKNCRDEVMSIAPETEAGVYLVPKVIE